MEFTVDTGTTRQTDPATTLLRRPIRRPVCRACLIVNAASGWVLATGLLVSTRAARVPPDNCPHVPLVRAFSHNDYRQHVLAIEHNVVEAFRTDSFPMRFLTTINGLEFVDAFRLNQYFNFDTRTLLRTSPRGVRSALLYLRQDYDCLGYEVPVM